MPSKSRFNDSWLDSERHKSWLAKCEKSVFYAYCKVCKKEFCLSNMGERALVSHTEGKKHQSKVISIEKNVPIPSFFQQPTSSSSDTLQSSSKSDKSMQEIQEQQNNQSCLKNDTEKKK